MKKRLFTRGIALGLAAVMLAGCSGSGTSTSQGSTDAGTTGQSAETQRLRDRSRPPLKCGITFLRTRQRFCFR